VNEATVTGRDPPAIPGAGRYRGTPWLERAWRGLLWGLMTLFVVNIGLMIAAVATSSFARRWLGTWLPDGWTTSWYVDAWKEFQLDSVLWVTVEVVFAVVVRPSSAASRWTSSRST